MALLRSAVWIALLFTATSVAAQPAPYIVAPQPLPGDFFAQAADVSADGRRVVGTSYGPAGTTVVVWEDLGAPVAITPGNDAAYAVAISGDGATVAGGRATGAFRWSAADGLVTLESVAGAAAIPIVAAVSFDGSILAGSAYVPVGGGLESRIAALWNGAALALFTPSGYPAGLPGYLTDLSSAVRMVGDAGPDSAQPGPFVWDGSHLDPVYRSSGTNSCGVEAISDDGSVWVGLCDESSIPIDFAPVRWSDAGGPQISYLTTTGRGVATDVSGDGSVVVGSVYDGPSRRPFVWTTATGFHFLEDVLADAGVDTSGVALDAIYDVHVSADGRTVVGEHFIARIPEPVPEPGAIPSGVAALLAAAWRARYRATRAPLTSACTS